MKTLALFSLLLFRPWRFPTVDADCTSLCPDGSSIWNPARIASNSWLDDLGLSMTDCGTLENLATESLNDVDCLTLQIFGGVRECGCPPPTDFIGPICTVCPGTTDIPGSDGDCPDAQLLLYYYQLGSERGILYGEEVEFDEMACSAARLLTEVPNCECFTETPDNRCSLCADGTPTDQYDEACLYFQYLYGNTPADAEHCQVLQALAYDEGCCDSPPANVLDVSNRCTLCHEGLKMIDPKATQEPASPTLQPTPPGANVSPRTDAPTAVMSTILNTTANQRGNDRHGLVRRYLGSDYENCLTDEMIVSYIPKRTNWCRFVQLVFASAPDQYTVDHVCCVESPGGGPFDDSPAAIMTKSIHVLMTVLYVAFLLMV